MVAVHVVRLPGVILYTVIVIHRGWVQLFGCFCVGILLYLLLNCVYLPHPCHLVYVNNTNCDGILHPFFERTENLAKICVT